MKTAPSPGTDNADQSCLDHLAYYSQHSYKWPFCKQIWFTHFRLHFQFAVMQTKIRVALCSLLLQSSFSSFARTFLVRCWAVIGFMCSISQAVVYIDKIKYPLIYLPFNHFSSWVARSDHTSRQWRHFDWVYRVQLTRACWSEHTQTHRDIQYSLHNLFIAHCHALDFRSVACAREQATRIDSPEKKRGCLAD